MRFLCIANPAKYKRHTTMELLKEACAQRDIEFVLVDPNQVSPTDFHSQPGDLLYRVATAHNLGAQEMEYHLWREDIVTFYKRYDYGLITMRTWDSLILPKFGVPTPKTVGYLSNNREVLRKAVTELGGFPIIVKAVGGSHGVGVMRVDSWQSLFSVADYINAQETKAVLKEYFDVRSSARLIVLGDKVIDSIEYRANDDDFRSNEGNVPNVVAKKFSAEIEAVAVKAVHALGLEFGGVDILFSDDKMGVAEVNFPCFFPRCQMLTGTDIAGQMIDYLVAKSKK